VTFDHELKQFFVVRNFAGPFVFAIFELDVNFQDFVWKFFAEELEVFCRSFLPKKLNLFWFWPIHIFIGKTRFNTHHFDADVAISFNPLSAGQVVDPGVH
jgi:hypothetical protein